MNIIDARCNHEVYCTLGVFIFSLLKHYLHVYLCLDVSKFYNLERGTCKFNTTISIVLRLAEN